MESALTERVIEEYERSLDIPAQPRRRLFILCPVGLVGAGKTTVTKPLAEMLSLVRISRDEMRKLLKERGQSYDTLDEMTRTLVHKHLSLGHSVAIDSDCAHAETIRLIQDCAQSYKALPLWIHIDPPEEFILHKLRTYKHTWLFKNGDDAIANYERRKPLHQHLPMPFIHTFDTSKPSLQEEIGEVAREIERMAEASD